MIAQADKDELNRIYNDWLNKKGPKKQTVEINPRTLFRVIHAMAEEISGLKVDLKIVRLELASRQAAESKPNTTFEDDDIPF